MNLGFDISQRLQFQQKMTPQMIQSLRLLQVGTLELETIIRAELEQNVCLEADMDIDMSADERLEEEEEAERERIEEGLDLERGGDEEPIERIDGEEGIDWEEYISEAGLDLGYSRNGEADPGAERYEAEQVYGETLEEHLQKQLSEKNLNGRLRDTVDFLISSLDDDGYLPITLGEAAMVKGVTKYEAEEALNALWRFDPAGVGARDLRECMILQLRARGMQDSLAMTIVSDYWGMFEKLRIPEISRQLGVEPREVQEAIDTLKTLNPKPGYQYGASGEPTIIPDLIVEKVDGKFVVTLNDGSIPSLHINRGYANMIRRGSKASGEAKEYVRERFNSALWLINSIEQRKRTIIRVMSAVVECQKDFFEKGPPNLRPLKMEEVAEKIDMHLSTVSRVANGKYVQTPHGIFELRSFFTSAVVSRGQGDGAAAEEGGADVTAERVRSRIRQIIEDEDPKRPVSDQKIAEILEKENLPAARRTVAKYREQMKILAARMRQKYD